MIALLCSFVPIIQCGWLKCALIQILNTKVY